MRRRALLLVVALLALGLTAGSAGGAMSTVDGLQFVDAPGETPTTVAPSDIETTERLVLSPTDARIDAGRVGVDPTVTTGTSFSRLESRYRTISMEAEMDAANGSEEEIAIVSEELDRIEGILSDDLDLERNAHESLAQGEQTPAELLRELTLLHIRSTVLDAELEALGDALRDVTAPVTSDEAQRLRGEVSQAQLEARTQQGPVTERMAAVMMAEEPDMAPVQIRASESGYVLATVQDGIFLRESLAHENRERGSGSGFTDIDGARAITAEHYPWTVDEAEETEDVPRGEIFSSTIDHSHGTTGIFIDAATEEPFRDAHELDLFSLPTETAADTSNENLSVTIERTFVGGPAQVAVADDSGESVAGAELLIDGESIGTTDDSGAHWFVTTGGSFEMSVDAEEGTATVPVELSD